MELIFANFALPLHFTIFWGLTLVGKYEGIVHYFEQIFI